jgi:hypothetical protein
MCQRSGMIGSGAVAVDDVVVDSSSFADTPMDHTNMNIRFKPEKNRGHHSRKGKP